MWQNTLNGGRGKTPSMEALDVYSPRTRAWAKLLQGRPGKLRPSREGLASLPFQSPPCIVPVSRKLINNGGKDNLNYVPTGGSNRRGDLSSSAHFSQRYRSIRNLRRSNAQSGVVRCVPRLWQRNNHSQVPAPLKLKIGGAVVFPQLTLH